MSEDDPTNRGDVPKQEFDMTDNFLDMSPLVFRDFLYGHFRTNPNTNVVIRVLTENLPRHLQASIKILQLDSRVIIKPE